MTWAPECTVKWDGLAVAILLFAIPLAIIMTSLTIVLYRKSVEKAMRFSAGRVVPARAPASHPTASSTPLRISLVHDQAGPITPQMAHSRAAMRAVSLVYVLAGLAQSALITVLYLWLNDIDLRPMRTFMVWLPFAWPIILTLSLTATSTRKQKYALMASYFLVLLAMDAAADFFELRYQPGFGELFLLWALNAAVPTVTMMLLGNRAWRSVGFIALFFSLVIVGSYLLGFQGLGCLVLSTRNTTLLSSMNYLLAGVMLLFLAGAWWSFRGLVRHYQAKGYSDQMLIVDSLWLLVTLIETLGQMGPSGMASLYYLSAFAAYKSVSMIGLRRIQATQAADTPQALLMLRVFGFTSRTRQLTDQIGHYWRYSGPINMIGGTDLATALIEPGELIQFWSRKLRQTFIADDADLQARLDTMDVGRDPDLRYRINECFCHDNTWQATVKALAQRSAVVLMDLRGFGKKNRGCEFELEMLLEAVPVSRVVLLVDRTTELESLKQVLQSAWDKLPESSNHALTEPVLSLFQVEDSGIALQPLLSRLFAAAAAA
jgi:hypothetical protein